jgi:hypothetical protein
MALTRGTKMEKTTCCIVGGRTRPACMLGYVLARPLPEHVDR